MEFKESKEFKEVKDISLYIHWGKFSGTKHTSFFRFAQGNFSLNSFNSFNFPYLRKLSYLIIQIGCKFTTFSA